MVCLEHSEPPNGQLEPLILPKETPKGQQHLPDDLEHLTGPRSSFSTTVRIFKNPQNLITCHYNPLKDL